jgi:hypothetical protein
LKEHVQLHVYSIEEDQIVGAAGELENIAAWLWSTPGYARTRRGEVGNTRHG